MLLSAGEPFLDILFRFTLVPLDMSGNTGILVREDGVEGGDLIFGTADGDLGSFGWISFRDLTDGSSILPFLRTITGLELLKAGIFEA